MAFTTLPTLRQKVADILGAVPILSAETVMIDDGLTKEQFEEALSKRGFIVLVGPVLGIRRAAGGSPLVIADAQFTIEFYANTVQNAQAANLNMLQVMQDCIGALSRHDAGQGERDFQGEFNLCELVTDAPGVLGYIAMFSKSVVID